MRQQTGDSSSVPAFNLKNYRRIEKYNNITNLISVLLFLLALAAIPVAFFSLQASRDGDTVVIFDPSEASLQSLYFFFPALEAHLYSQVTGTSRRGNVTDPPVPVRLLLSEIPNNNLAAGSSEIAPEILANFTVPAAELFHLYWAFGDPSKFQDDSSVFTPHLKKLWRRSCSDGPQHTTFPVTNGTVYLVCSDQKLLNPRVDFLLTVATDIANQPPGARFYFRGMVITQFVLQNPKTWFNGINACETPSCSIGTEIDIVTRGGRVIKQTFEAFSLELTAVPNPSLLASPFNVFTNSRNSLRVPSSKAPPPSLTVNSFILEDKYSTGDTIIDSLAISGIIVSIVLLTVTLAKLLLFIVLNPGRR